MTVPMFPSLWPLEVLQPTKERHLGIDAAVDDCTWITIHGKAFYSNRSDWPDTSCEFQRHDGM